MYAHIQTYKHAHTETYKHAHTHMQWHQLGKFFLTESSQNLEERARSCLCCTEAAYLPCDLYTHEHLSGLSKRTHPTSRCRYRVMFSALQIITTAQESADSSVAMAVSQLLAKSPLLQYKVTTLVSFLHVAMWLASPTGLGTQVTCAILPAQDFFQLQKPPGCWLEQRTPKPSNVVEAQLKSPRKGVKITCPLLFCELLVCSNPEARLVTAATASLSHGVWSQEAEPCSAPAWNMARLPRMVTTETKDKDATTGVGGA